MEINKKAVGKRIRNIRLMLGYTMAEFGKIVGEANQSLVARWENGTSLPKADRIAILADISGLDEESLLYGIQPYDLPDHIQKKIIDPDINKYFEVEDYQTYLEISGKSDGVETRDTFNEIQLLAQISRNKKNADYLYALEQKEQLKIKHPTKNQAKIDYDLKDLLNSSSTIGFENKQLTTEQKRLILDVLTPLVKYFN